MKTEDIDKILASEELRNSLCYTKDREIMQACFERIRELTSQEAIKYMDEKAKREDEEQE